jgi:hypothetical protein
MKSTMKSRILTTCLIALLATTLVEWEQNIKEKLTNLKVERLEIEHSIQNPLSDLSHRLISFESLSFIWSDQK